MSIPEAVQKQIDEATQIYKSVYEPGEKEEPKPGEGDTTQTGETGKTDEKTSEEALKAPEKIEEPPEKKEEEIKTPPQPTDLNAALAEMETLRQEVARLQDENQKLVHKNSVITGKYNAEVKAEVPDLMIEIESLKSEIAKLKKSDTGTAGASIGDALRQATTVQADEAIKRLSDDLGPEYVKDLQTIFSSMFEGAVKPIKSRLDTVHAETAKSARERYVTDLTEGCPEWEAIKVDPRFSIFLDEIDQGSGKKRYDLAYEGMKDGNAQRVAYWYNRFKQETGWKPTQPAGDTGKSSKDKAKEKYIAPAGSPSGSQRETEKKFIKASELEQFATDVKTGRYKGREDEQKRRQAEIDEATRERRILAGQ